MAEQEERRLEAINYYFYTVRIKDLDAFQRAMDAEGVEWTFKTYLTTFRSPKLIDMKRYKRQGMLKSYIIFKVGKAEEILEEG